MEELSKDQIKELLATERGRGPKVDLTTIRDISSWFKLNAILREEGCDNPNCTDPRTSPDRGRNVVVLIKGQHMCRYCFLEGWLL